MPGLSFLNGRNIRNSDTHGSQIQSPGGEGAVVGSAKSGVPCGEHTLADNRVGTRARTLQLYKASAQGAWTDSHLRGAHARRQPRGWVHRAPPAFSVGISTARAPNGLTSPTVTCHRYYSLCLSFSLRCYSPEGGASLSIPHSPRRGVSIAVRGCLAPGTPMQPL